MNKKHTVPLLYRILHRKLYESATWNGSMELIVSFADFKSTANGYYRIGKQWFEVAKEMESFGLIEIIRNHYFKLK